MTLTHGPTQDSVLLPPASLAERQKYEEELLFQKSLLESQTEASIDGILVIGNDGKVLLHNRRFLNLWAVCSTMIARASDAQLLDAVRENVVDADEFQARVQYLYDHPDEVSSEQVALRDGRVFDRYSAPVKSREGVRYGRVWFFRDVSEQVRDRRQIEALAAELSRQQKWLEGLLHRLPVPVVFIAPDTFHITFANHAAGRFAPGVFARLPQPLQGAGAPESGFVAAALLTPCSLAAAGQEVHGYQAEWLAPEGTRSILVHGQRLAARHDHPAVIVLAFDDVTELKNTQDKLQHAVRARDEFLSIASHELKTPVTALHLQIQNILRAANRDDEKVSREWLLGKVTRSETQLLRLSRLIDNLLDVSRIAAGRLEFEPEDLDVGAVAAETADRLREDATRAGSELIVETAQGVTGYWDRLRLEQVVTNLITNATKYGGGQPILLTVRAEAEHVLVQVEDHGIGISAENQARIFERFERAVSDREYGGLGLGLWITRQIVEALGGRISVQSEPGKGSKFTVALPRAGLSATGDSSAPPPPPEAPPH